MNSREISLWLDERWYDALSRELEKKDTTIEDELNEYLDQMLNQLPSQVYERISREIWEEDQQQRQQAEANRRISVFRVTQDGRTDHLLMEGARFMSVLRAALQLRSYLLRKANSPERFTEALKGAVDIASEVFKSCADELREGTGRIVSALDIDLDHSEFSVLDPADGWEVYTIRDVSTAAWHADRKDSLAWDRRLDIFAARLEGKMVRCEGPELEGPVGPSM